MRKISTWARKQWKIVKSEFTNEPPKKIIKNLLLVFLGAVLVAFGDSFFVIPMNIISGGVASISMLIHKIPGFSVLPVNTYVLIVTWTFFILGLIFLGLKYSLHTLIYTISYPLVVMLFSYISTNVIVDNIRIFDITQLGKDIEISNGIIIPFEGNKDAMLLLAYFVSSVLGGLLIGSGMGLTLAGGGSSGGTDVINLLANKYLHIKVGTSSFIVDSILILAGFFTNGFNLLPTLVGLITALLCSIMIDKVFLGNNQYYLAMIISKKWPEINEFINEHLGRGTTLLKAQGGYTKHDTVVLEVCFDRVDYNIIRESINAIDPNAFVTVMQTKEILGYGFSRATPKSDRQDIAMSADETRKLVSKARTKRKNTFKEDF